MDNDGPTIWRRYVEDFTSNPTYETLMRWVCCSPERAHEFFNFTEFFVRLDEYKQQGGDMEYFRELFNRNKGNNE